MQQIAQLDILIVDDHEMMRDLLVRVLSDAGAIKIREADGGEAALVELQRRPADFIFADYNMPGMNGAALIAAVRAKAAFATPRIIIISGVNDAREHSALRAAGADAVLVKPVRAAELLRAVERVLVQERT